MFKPMSYEEVKESVVNAKTKTGYISRLKDVVTFNLPSEIGFLETLSFVVVDKGKIRVKAPKGFVIACDALKTKRGGYIESASGNSLVALANMIRPDSKKKQLNVMSMIGNWTFETTPKRKPRLKPGESVIA